MNRLHTQIPNTKSTQPDPNTQVNLTITLADLEIILAGLGELQTKVAFDTVTKVVNRRRAVLKITEEPNNQQLPDAKLE